MSAELAEYIRSEKDLRQAAEFQFRALKISADHFDLGEYGEAARMATALFVLAGEGARWHPKPEFASVFGAQKSIGRIVSSTRAKMRGQLRLGT